jgi:DNA polymerase-1
MLGVAAWLEAEAPDACLIMQVHDELVIEAPEAEIEAIRVAVVAIMEGAAALSVPLRVDSGVGSNWDEAH